MRTWLAVAILASELVSADAFARDSDANVCGYAKDNDQRIAACTRVLAMRLSLFNRAAGLSDRGQAYENKGEYDQAISDYDEALKINPKADVYYNNRGLAMMERATTIARLRIMMRP